MKDRRCRQVAVFATRQRRHIFPTSFLSCHFLRRVCDARLLSFHLRRSPTHGGSRRIQRKIGFASCAAGESNCSWSSFPSHSIHCRMVSCVAVSLRIALAALRRPLGNANPFLGERARERGSGRSTVRVEAAERGEPQIEQKGQGETGVNSNEPNLAGGE